MAKLSAISASNEKENDNRTNDWAFCYHLPMLRLILTLVLILPISAAMADVTGMARVVDGDTIWIGNKKIRLWAIDAPETKQECHRNEIPWICGVASTEHLKLFIANKSVTCEDRGKDRYKRLIGKCRVGSLDIGAEMIEAGMAMPYWKYGGDYYMQVFLEARGQGIGMFAGTYMPPWEWRRRRRI